MTGLLLVDKPEGVTSAGVIRTLKPLFAGAKVGHLGTLDPFASGLLPLCLGEATKVARYLLLEEKSYEGRIQLGTTTDTLDRTGAVIETAPVPPLSAPALVALASRFTGPQEQVPPMYSALKRDGVPLYVLARRGIEVERAPRAITIKSLQLSPHDPDAINFTVRCTKGTYIRVLAADLAIALGTVGHLTILRRTAVGAFDIAQSHSVAALQERTGPLPLLGIREALANLRTFPITEPTRQALVRGRQQPLQDLSPPITTAEAALLLDRHGEVAAIIESTSEASWRLVRILQS